MFQLIYIAVVLLQKRMTKNWKVKLSTLKSTYVEEHCLVIVVYSINSYKKIRKVSY